jgi:hypothetical protein
LDTRVATPDYSGCRYSSSSIVIPAEAGIHGSVQQENSAAHRKPAANAVSLKHVVGADPGLRRGRLFVGMTMGMIAQFSSRPSSRHEM